MAKKSAKMSRPRKKRKYTRRIPEYKQLKDAMDKAKDGDTIFVNPPTNPDPPRASEQSYVFINGNRVSVRNLTDETLNEKYEQLSVSAFESGRQTDLLRELQYNMSIEQGFRGLK